MSSKVSFMTFAPLVLLLTSSSIRGTTASSSSSSSSSSNSMESWNPMPSVRSAELGIVWERAIDEHHHQQHQRRRRQEETSIITESQSCELHFVKCLDHAQCTACFQQLKLNSVDWTTLAKGTDCRGQVIKALNDEKFCMDLGREGNGAEVDVFCNVVDNCALKKDGDDNADGGNNDDANNNNNNNNNNNTNNTRIDCDALQSCQWEGFKPSYVGDGTCHEWLTGCYNHKICGYDGGDCCPDTCNDEEISDYKQCGSDGWKCRDPNSSNCTMEYCDDGNNNDRGGDDDDFFKGNCPANETEYELTQYASFGNGWGDASMTITSERTTQTEEREIYSGTLKSGASASKAICLPATSTCYSVNVKGGTWGNELSWTVRPSSPGAREIANGGAPISCRFPVGPATNCDRTCNGQAEEDPTKDEDRKSFDELSECIRKKCFIQLYTCNDDELCRPCMGEIAPAYCYATENFKALVDCTLCGCMPEKTEGNFCDDMPADSAGIGSDDVDDMDDATGTMRSCTSDEQLDGTDAVLDYHACSGIDGNSALSTIYDNDNFGMLDAFESCATAYKTEPYHGGKRALDCMRILKRAIDQPADTRVEDGDVPVRAISSLAKDLYNNGKEFCDCSAKADAKCPMCRDFVNFKTLLYESLDGCRALDDIDCDAWAEFYEPCRNNILQKFRKVDFTNTAQCSYIHDGCGDAGPFPSFRNISCESEIPAEAWNFYRKFESGCITGGANDNNNNNDNDNDNSKPAPRPVPVPAPTVTPPVPVPPPKRTSSPTKEYIPSGGKPYVPPEERTERKRTNTFKKFLFVCIVSGAAYWYYKRRPEFDYMQFRRARNFRAPGGESAMYESLNMEHAGNSFEPPSLPPPPSHYGNGHVA